MSDVEQLRLSVAAWIADAAEQLRREYPAAHIDAHVYDTPAFALRAGVSVTRGDPAVATEDVVVSVDGSAARTA